MLSVINPIKNQVYVLHSFQNENFKNHLFPDYKRNTEASCSRMRQSSCISPHSLCQRQLKTLDGIIKQI